MFVFILLITVLAALFVLSCDYELRLKNSMSAGYGVRSLIVSLLFAAPFLILPAYWSGFVMAQIVLGTFFVLFCFLLLSMLPAELLPLKLAEGICFRIYLPFCALVAGISGIGLLQAVVAVLIFAALWIVLKPIWPRFLEMLFKSRENVKEFLALNRQLLGIFTFILALVIATDRVRFIENFVKWLFN